MLIRINRRRGFLALSGAVTFAAIWLLPLALVIVQAPVGIASAADQSKPITAADIKAE